MAQAKKKNKTKNKKQNKNKNRKRREQILITSTDLEARLPNFESWPHLLLIWATHLTSESPGFLIYKMGIMVPTSLGCGEECMNLVKQPVQCVGYS